LLLNPIPRIWVVLGKNQLIHRTEGTFRIIFLLSKMILQSFFGYKICNGVDKMNIISDNRSLVTVEMCSLSLFKIDSCMAPFFSNLPGFALVH
jgi:hypothetical protein